jgi:hypothetical protein
MQPGSAQPGPNPFRYPQTLLLSNPGGNGNHQFSGWSGGAKVFFGETDELDAVGS